MQVEIITKDDLRQFKTELLNELSHCVKPQEKVKEWLKSAEIRNGKRMDQYGCYRYVLELPHYHSRNG
ncbi:hypothetical protein [Pedobacter sp. NJ-S-72]